MQPTTRRGWVVAAVVALTLATASLVESASGTAEASLTVTGVLLAVAMGVAVVLAYPLPLVGLLVDVACTTAPALIGPTPRVGGSQLIATMVLLGYASFRLSLRVATAAYVVSALVPALSIVVAGQQPWEVAFYLLFLAPAWGVGLLLQRERTRSAELRTLTAQLATERERRAEVAVAAERSRIAQELHDAVAHSVSVMTLQVGVVRRRLEQDSVERQTLEAAESLGRQSVAELRRIVGMVRPEQEGSLAPLPSLSNLGELVDHVRASGVVVSLSVHGEAVLAPAVDMSAFRVVQEAVTNALRHAPGAVIAVSVDFRPTSLTVSVTDTGPGRAGHPGPDGNGLTGMRERVGVLGGQLRTGDRPDGGFEVVATFPVADLAPVGHSR